MWMDGSLGLDYWKHVPWRRHTLQLQLSIFNCTGPDLIFMQTLFSRASIPITQLILSILIVSVPPFIMGRHSYLCLSSELKSAIHSHSPTSIRPVMMYGAKCWAIKEQHIQKMSVAECVCCVGYVATQVKIESKMMIFGTNLR
jgi:hypothetical protein